MRALLLAAALALCTPAAAYDVPLALSEAGRRQLEQLTEEQAAKLTGWDACVYFGTKCGQTAQDDAEASVDAAALTLQQFDADVERLDAAGQVAKLRGYALAFLGAASTGGLEILVGDANKAYKLAATYCDGFFQPAALWSALEDPRSSARRHGGRALYDQERQAIATAGARNSHPSARKRSRASCGQWWAFHWANSPKKLNPGLFQCGRGFCFVMKPLGALWFDHHAREVRDSGGSHVDHVMT